MYCSLVQGEDWEDYLTPSEDPFSAILSGSPLPEDGELFEGIAEAADLPIASLEPPPVAVEPLVQPPAQQAVVPDIELAPVDEPPPAVALADAEPALLRSPQFWLTISTVIQLIILGGATGLFGQVRRECHNGWPRRV